MSAPLTDISCTEHSESAISGRFVHTHALQVALASSECRASHTGEMWSEAMLLGLGGGLSAGSLIWNFHAYNAAVLTLGFHHCWNEPERWYRNVLRRIGAEGIWRQASGHRRADRALESAIRHGHNALCWVDEHHLPYLHVNAAFDGCFGWVATVTAIKDEQVKINEVWGQPMRVDTTQFQQGRRRNADHRHRLLFIANTMQAPQLHVAIREAISDHVTHLSSNSNSIGLGALRSWARTMVDNRSRRGWGRLFVDGKQLASVFRSMYEGIVARGMDGAGLRCLYADFLRESAAVTDDATLIEAATLYDNCAARWTDLALTPFLQGGQFGIDPTPMTAYLAAMHDRFEALKTGDTRRIEHCSEALNGLNSQLDATPPWTPSQQALLLASLSERVQALWLMERRALSKLRQWLDSTQT